MWYLIWKKIILRIQNYFPGECSEGVCDDVVCQYGGVCKVTSADSHVCLCPVGTGGENCQHGKKCRKI